MIDSATDSASAAASRFGRMASQAAGSAGRALHLDEGDMLSSLMRNPAVVGGGILGLIGLFRRSPLAAAAGVVGLALAARSSGGSGSVVSNLLGSGRGKRIELEKSIRIDAAPDEVYDMWTHYENFPRFMSHVVEVRDIGKRRSHWTVQGPAGTQFEFDSVLTEQTKNRRLAWRSEPGAQIPNSGSVEFEPHRGGTDRHRAPVLLAAGRRARPCRGLAVRVRPERPDGRRPGAHEAVHRARRDSARCRAARQAARALPALRK